VRRATALGLLVAVLVSLVAACGDDGGEDADTTEPSDDTTSTTEAVADTTSADAPNASDRLRTFLDAQYPDFAATIEGIGSVDLAPDEVQVTLTIGDEPADVDTGVAICEAVVAFAEDDGLAVIEIEVENDENGDDALLATGDLDDGCEAA
jgi:hypothetical protein